MKTQLLKYFTIAFTAISTISCEDFLDKEPPSYVVPEDYYHTEEQIQAIANNFYENLPSHGDSSWGYGYFDDDNGTDNQAGNRWKICERPMESRNGQRQLVMGNHPQCELLIKYHFGTLQPGRH